MKLNQLLESFYDMYKAPPYAIHMGEYTVYKDPTKKETSETMGESTHPSLRFIADPNKKDLYVFPSDIMHELVAKKIYSSTPPYLLFGIADKSDGELKARFGQIWGYDVKQKTYYKSILKTDWEWLNKYFNMAPLFATVMTRYKK